MMGRFSIQGKNANLEIGYKPIQKPIYISPFWGNIGVKRGLNLIFWCPKLGTFVKSARIQVPKKGTLGVQCHN